MLKGLTVTVLTPTQSGEDRLGNPINGEPIPTVVDNVLVAPGGVADLEASRPDGVRVDLTLHFPKTFTADLRGCSVVLPAPYTGEYAVIGEPKPLMVENTPGEWWLPVEVVAVHG